MPNIASIIAAFAGGIFGALIGALPSFIFAGFVGLVGAAVAAAGGSADLLNMGAFGPLLGPHIAFAGGVAASAFAAKKKLTESGTDITTPMNGVADISVLLVGGVFGVIGHLINSVFTNIGLKTDTVALTVAISGIIVRFVFGNTGLTGKFQPKDKNDQRSFIPDGKTLAYIALYSLAAGFVFAYLVDITGITVLGFCVSAAMLIFAQTGFPMAATHHITLVAGLATAQTGNIYIGALFAVFSGILCEIAARIFNSHCDTHIDPPAIAIFISAFIIFLL